MIFTDKAARSQIATLESRIGELEADIIAKDQAIESHNDEITAKDQTIAEHIATIGNLTERITALEATAARVPELESAVTAAQASASVVATEMLASIGQPEPLAIEQSEPPVDHAAIFATLTGQSRTEYYAKHGAEIRKSITK